MNGISLDNKKSFSNFEHYNGVSTSRKLHFMKIENENTVVRIQALKTLFAIIVLSLICVLYTTNIEAYSLKYLGISNRINSLILIIIYLIFYFYHLAVKTSYLYFSDEGFKIIIRFYPLKPINPKKSSIEIPKNQFYKFTYRKGLLREEVTVYQRFGTNISKYPPFSLKGLKKEQKTKLFLTLKGYQQEENV